MCVCVIVRQNFSGIIKFGLYWIRVKGWNFIYLNRQKYILQSISLFLKFGDNHLNYKVTFLDFNSNFFCSFFTLTLSLYSAVPLSAHVIESKYIFNVSFTETRLWGGMAVHYCVWMDSGLQLTFWEQFGRFNFRQIINGIFCSL